MSAFFKICLKTLLIVGLALAVFTGTVYAAFPEKPIAIIVGRSAGGGTDKVARSFIPFLERHMGVPIIVKNMRGGGGRMANRYFSKLQPDGYKLLMAVLPSDVTQQLLKKPDYDLRNFTPLYGVGGGDSNGLMVPYDSEIKTFKDLLEASQKKQITLSVTAFGGNSWLLAEQLKQRADLKYKPIPFDSGNEATVAVVGKHVTAGIANSTNLPDMIRQKKVRSLGVAAGERLSYLPDTPTFKELGYPTVRTVTRQVLVAPPGMSAEMQKLLADFAAKAVSDPDFIKLAEKQKFSLGPMAPKELREEIGDTFGSIAELLEKVKK